jgi:hypothetical protein
LNGQPITELIHSKLSNNSLLNFDMTNIKASTNQGDSGSDLQIDTEQ